MKKMTIAISGINAVDNPGPGTGIARSLKESSLSVRTIGLAYDAMEPGIYLDQFIDIAYLMPYPSGDKEAYLERLAYIHEKEKIDILISALDAELPVFIDSITRLHDMGIKLLLPTKEMFKMRNKSELKTIADAIGIKVPAYFSCTSIDDLFRSTDEVGFPCMIKGPFYEAFRANSSMEAEGYFNKIAAKWGYPIIVQKFIEGEEYDVIGLGDGTGKEMGIFAIKKMTTTALGKVWNAVSIKNARLAAATEKLVKHLKWRGGFEFEVLIEHKSQQIFLLEINPRFPAWVYMSSACGINLPERMVRFLMFNESDFPKEYETGKMMIRYTAEILKNISDFEKIIITGELDNTTEKEEIV
jgi:carbamoyl-phosphate synthase large subunit